MSDSCDFCRAGSGIICVPDASKYCEECAIGVCDDCVNDGGLVKDEKDGGMYYCENCLKTKRREQEAIAARQIDDDCDPVIADAIRDSLELPGYNDATRIAVETIVDPRSGAWTHQRTCDTQ